jgi:lipopolysaccharide biosynthesis protein
MALWLNRIRSWLTAVNDWLIFFFCQLLRPFNFVHSTFPGIDPLSGSKLAAVYAHYDGEGLIHDYVIHQLGELAAAGFRIVFVSNSPKFPPESVAQVSPFCRSILWRYNVGYDFGAYKDGLNAVDGKDDLAALLLMNDSIYGPFFGLRDQLNDIDRSNTDFWGITDSWERRFHVQSYFILFFANALNSKPFKKFWCQLPYVNHKGWIIRNGEIKLSKVLTRHKLRANVLAPYWSVAKKVLDRVTQIDTDSLPDAHRNYLKVLLNNLIDGRPMNPMHYFWETLILEYKCPFLKRELVKSNPVNVPFAWRWPEVVQHASDYDIALIRRHLQS